MGQQENPWWDAEQMFNLYLHDYLVKKNLHGTAAIFLKETGISNTPVAIDCPKGFLQEWWSLFYDVYASRMYQESEAEASLKGVELTEVQLRNIDQLALGSLMNHHVAGQFSSPSDCSELFGQDAVYPLAFRNYQAGQDLDAYSNSCSNLWRSNVHQPTVLMPIAASSSHDRQHMSDPVLEQFIRKQGNYTGQGKIRRVDDQLYRELKSQVTEYPITGMRERGDLTLTRWPLDKQVKKLRATQTEVPVLRWLCVPRNFNYGFHENSTEFMLHGGMPPNKNASRYNAQMVQMTQIPDHQWKGSEIEQEMETNKVEDMPLDENIEYFKRYENDSVSIQGTLFNTLREQPLTCNRSMRKGFTFQEIGCLRSHKGKIRCCRFSSDGKLLATAGDDKAACIWDMDTLDILSTSDQCSRLITDVCFKPSSTIFATSSYDKSVQIWDAASPSRSPFMLMGHAEAVMSLDFHPTVSDILCSSDNNNLIRLWHLQQSTCLRTLKGGARQVRFQPRVGKLIATASGKQVNVIDIETATLLFSLKGHAKQVASICWDGSGQNIASVSEDGARLWSVSSQECRGEILSNGNKFQSCTFHPTFSQFLIIGGYQSLQFWNPSERRCRKLGVEAHKGTVSSVAGCPETGIVASGGYDQCVKLWN